MRVAVAALAIIASAGCGRYRFDPLGDGDAQAGDGALVGDSALVPGTQVVLSATGQCPAVAWDGSSIGAVWREGGFTGTTDVMFGRYDLAGVALQGPFVVGSALDNVECPAIAWTGSQFLIALSYGPVNRHDVDVFTVSASSVGTFTNVVNDSGDSTSVQLAVRGTQVLLAWADQTGTNYNVLARPLSATGAPTAAAFTVSGLEPTNGPPWISVTSTGFVISFSGNGAPHLRALDATGALAATEVAMTGAATGLVSSTWTGTDLLGMWCEFSTDVVTTARFDLTGTVTSGPFMVTVNGITRYTPLVWTGSGALATWAAAGIQVAHLAADGQLVSRATIMNAGFNALPSMAWTGTQLVVASENGAGALFKVIAAP